MAVGEFELIARYFQQQNLQRDDVLVGIGDDGAVLTVAPGKQLVVAMDTLVAGVHFPEQASPFDIGYKALAVNLSDLAAMGAEPAWFTLALTLPEADEAWLQEFSRGLFTLARRHMVQLVGGDTTRGPLTITVQAHGFVSDKVAMRRSTARAGDRIYVTGPLGDAALALQSVLGKVALPEEHSESLLQRLHRPTPRVTAGLALRGLTSSCIDISDGLLADLGHICSASKVGAVIRLADIPLSEGMRAAGIDPYPLALSGGDDYELLCTIPPGLIKTLERALYDMNVQLHCIGEIEAGSGVRCLDQSGAPYQSAASGYQHFQPE